MSDKPSKMKRTPLRYLGGKNILSGWIIDHFPAHLIYVEPFGGGASVLLKKQRSKIEVYNDKWDLVVNVFRVLQDPVMSNQLKAKLKVTPYSRSEWAKAKELTGDPVEDARRLIIRSFQSFGSGGISILTHPGWRSGFRTDATCAAHDWANYPDHIELFTNRLKGVIIDNMDWEYIINKYDGSDTLFYVDPPYPHATRPNRKASGSYVIEFTDEEHIRLCNSLLEVKGKVILSSYKNRIYDEILAGWRVIRKKTNADGARVRIEALYINPAAMVGSTIDMNLDKEHHGDQ